MGESELPNSTGSQVRTGDGGAADQLRERRIEAGVRRQSEMMGAHLIHRHVAGKVVRTNPRVESMT